MTAARRSSETQQAAHLAERLRLTFAARAELAGNAVGKRLYETMSAKESNVCLALDETDPHRFLALAEQLGPEIAVLKTHIDTLEGYTGKVAVDLANLAREHNFLIFEDRKFADIGQTVKNQYTKGVFHVIEWADIVNAHALPGPGIVAGLREEVTEYGLIDQRAILLLAQMSSANNLITPEYTKAVVELGTANQDFVIGYIGAGLADLPSLAAQILPSQLILTPGAKFAGEGDTLGQQYATPVELVLAGADLVVVGRDIFQDAKPLDKAKQYREVSWQAYRQRISQSKT